MSGSSRMRTSGSCTIAWAIFTRWRMPFEYVDETAVVAGIEVDLVERRVAATGRIGQPLQHGREPHELEGGQRLEQRVLLRHEADAVGQRELAMGILAEHADQNPATGAVSPESIRSIVDLPAPLGPSRAR